MNANRLEPGLLQVFRGYAILRTVLLLITPVIAPLLGSAFDLPRGIDDPLHLVLLTVDVVVLLVYLYWPWLKHKLGKLFLPLALLFAMTSLIIEQYIVSPNLVIWEPIPYAYILLILAAWQYSFKHVVIFGVASALFELVMLSFFPPEIPFAALPDDLLLLIPYVGVTTRTITFIILGYVVTHLMRAQREQRAKLAQANLKLVQHAATLEQLTISRERNRLSRELHDTLAHTLSGFAVQLDALISVWEPIPERPRQMLTQMLETVRSGLDETRRALKALRASPLDDMGLALAVRSLAEDFAARQNFALELDIPENLDDLSPEVEQGYYRIAQEGLENIARHANPEQVTIRITQHAGRLTMFIRDDGVGFDPDAAISEHQFGIQGMRERAELIGAELKIESEPKRGTSLVLVAGL
jgi:signal transduction histidine kinase